MSHWYSFTFLFALCLLGNPRSNFHTRGIWNLAFVYVVVIKELLMSQEEKGASSNASIGTGQPSVAQLAFNLICGQLQGAEVRSHRESHCTSLFFLFPLPSPPFHPFLLLLLLFSFLLLLRLSLLPIDQFLVFLLYFFHPFFLFCPNSLINSHTQEVSYLYRSACILSRRPHMQLTFKRHTHRHTQS